MSLESAKTENAGSTISLSPQEQSARTKRRYRYRRDRKRATMEASTEDLHKFIAFLWGNEEELPNQIPRLSLDIWLDILLAVRKIIDNDPEKHRYTSIKSRIKQQYPDNVFSWMLNQLVELGFLTKKREALPALRVGVRYFLTESGAALVAMFDSVAAQKQSSPSKS